MIDNRNSNSSERDQGKVIETAQNKAALSSRAGSKEDNRKKSEISPEENLMRKNTLTSNEEAVKMRHADSIFLKRLMFLKHKLEVPQID
jgi:hypothetical protein